MPTFIVYMLVVFTTSLYPLTSAKAQPRDQEIEALKERIRRLEEQQSVSGATSAPPIEPAIEEVTKLKLDLELPEPLTHTYSGLSSGASKIYFSRSPLAIGAYGETTFSTADSGAPRRMNLARFNTYLGFRFSRTIIFNSAVAYQNGGVLTGPSAVNQPAAVRIEFAYLDFRFDDEAGIRVGNILIPVGLLNLRHEPNLYLPVTRFETEQSIIPTAWHENGIEAYSRMGTWLAKFGVVNSGVADRAQTATWIRASRQNGALADATDLAYFLRIESDQGPFNYGLSLYSGDSSQGKIETGKSTVQIAALHAEYEDERFSIGGLWAEGRISDADKISAVTGQNIASRVRGAYAVMSYDVLPRIGPLAARLIGQRPPPGHRSLPIFISYESVDPQAEMPAGLAPDLTARAKIMSVGANYRPHPQVVIKGAYVERRPESGSWDRGAQAAIGFVF